MSEPTVPAGGRTSDGEPRPVADIDENLFDQLKPLHRLRWMVLLGFTLLASAAMILLAVGYHGTAGQLHRTSDQLRDTHEQLVEARQVIAEQQKEIKASCEFWNGILTLPAAPTPPAARPSRVLIALIASSRDAWAGERCGPLPPAPSDLRHWAAVYQVPLHH